MRRILTNLSTAIGCYLVLVLFMGSIAWAAPATFRNSPRETNLDTETVNYDSGGTNISAFLAKPQA
jgi:hypothetical protein